MKTNTYKYILLVGIIVFLLYIINRPHKNVKSRKTDFKFRRTNSKLIKTESKSIKNILLQCFNNTEITNFNKYYSQVTPIQNRNSIVFTTPNQIIPDIPHITWNGVFLNNLCVDPTMRNKGIGTQLVSQVIKNAKLQGKDHIILQVENNNLAAINIYEKLGFTKYMQGINKNGKMTSIYLYKI